MKKILLTSGAFLVILVLVVLLVADVFNVSPIFDFRTPEPFSGPDIFNPYETLDTTVRWKRANFHTHTRVDSPLNECDKWPAEVYEAYASFGYDIVTFSNHNALTVHPFDTALQVNVYEHGYNLFKYHLLVFGSPRVNRFDHILPFLTSQRQWKMDLLRRDSDFIQMNHPFRTNFTTRKDLERLTGYRIIELDSGITTEQEYWDWALSAGHYSFALANDDLHYPDRSDRIAVRTNFLCCGDATYQQISDALLSGRFYCMRVPDFGNGDWTLKYAGNASLPSVRNIGLNGTEAFVDLSAPAALIKAVGQDGKLLASAENAASLHCDMGCDEPYLRFTAYFEDGTVIYTNPFARYDASVSDSPYMVEEHSVNLPLTLLYNLLLVLVAAGCIAAAVQLVRKVKSLK